MGDWLDDWLESGSGPVDEDWDYSNYENETEDVTIYTDENGDKWDSEGRKIGSKKKNVTVEKKKITIDKDDNKSKKLDKEQEDKEKTDKDKKKKDKKNKVIKKKEEDYSSFGDGGNEGDKNNNNPYDYARIIMQNNKFISFYGEEILYWFNPENGKYDINGESIVKKLVQKVSNKEFRGARKNHVTETVDLLKRNFLRPRLQENEYKYTLLVGNGIMDTSSLKYGDFKEEDFSPGFDSGYFILSGIPWDYDPKADCPKIKKFILELIVGKEKCKQFHSWKELYEGVTLEERNKGNTLFEFIGYCLLRSCDFKKCIILKGGPDSGKSKFTDLVEKFLGFDSCSGVSLQEMRKEYNIAEIYGKMANVRAELSGRRLEDTSIIKIFINGDPITGRIIRSRPIRFRPYAKLLYATNIIPAASLSEDASFFGKIIIIDCPNTFQRNDAFFDSISTPEEMSGLLNAALRGLGRLIINKRFSYEPSADQIAIRFPRYGDNGRSYDEE